MFEAEVGSARAGRASLGLSVVGAWLIAACGSSDHSQFFASTEPSPSAPEPSADVTQADGGVASNELPPSSCEPTETPCAGRCVSRTDPSYGCGRCAACPLATNAATMACVAGGCIVGTCAPGFADCNGNPADGCEARLDTSTEDCGACGVRCPNILGVAMACVAGRCVASCPDGTPPIAGACEAGGSACFADADNDGFPSSVAISVGVPPCAPGTTPRHDAIDCAPNDPNAFPTQTKYFKTPVLGVGGFDYDCDGKIEWIGHEIGLPDRTIQAEECGRLTDAAQCNAAVKDTVDATYCGTTRGVYACMWLGGVCAKTLLRRNVSFECR
jgi:hypothetical protein